MMQIPCPLCRKNLRESADDDRYTCDTEVYDPVIMACLPHYMIHGNGDISIRVTGYWILHEKSDNKMGMHRITPRDTQTNRMTYKNVIRIEPFEIKSEEQVIKKIELIKVFL